MPGFDRDHVMPIALDSPVALVIPGLSGNPIVPLAGREERPWGVAPRSAQPPETAYSGGGAKISLSPRSIMCRFQPHLTFMFLSTISGQNVLNRHFKFALGNKKACFRT